LLRTAGTCYTQAMPKRSRRPRDVNQLAKAIADEATGNATPPGPESVKNPHAVALGKLGGQRGGAARARKLTKERRQEIARKAARARWSK